MLINLNNSKKVLKIPAPSYPLILNIESVYGCPYDCIMCDVEEKKPLSMPLELLKKLESVYPYLKLLGIHGNGEPLLGKYIDYILEICHRNNIILHMNTTGFFLNYNLMEKLLNGPRVSIGFSINAGKDNTYRKIMGHEFKIVKENIKYLLERNSQLGKKDNEFFLSFIVMKENINEIFDFLHLAKNLGVKNVRFMRLLPKPKTIKGAFRKKEKFKFYYFEQFNKNIKKRFIQMFPQIKHVAQKLEINIVPGDLEFESTSIIKEFFKKFSPFRVKGFCLAPFIGGAIVRYNGDVHLCCGVVYKIGNLYKNSFEEIWNSERMKKIKELFSSGYLLSTVCRGCRTVRLEEYPNRLIIEHINQFLKGG